MLPRTRSPRLLLCAALAVAALSSACRDEPTALLPSFARGSGGPSVRSTDPDSAPQDTTLDVHVYGSGFDNGSRVTFPLHGDTLSTNIRTNSTRYVSSSELVANVTIAANAVPAKYDVKVVTSQGKPGIGTELFTVELRAIDLGPTGGGRSWAYSLNVSGHVVGVAYDPSSGLPRGFFWSGGVMEDLGTYPGTNSSHAYGINDLDQVVGWSACSPGCPPLYDVPVLWERVDGAWAVRPLPIPGLSAQAQDINNAGQIIGVASGKPVVWTVQGGTITYEPLPMLSGTAGCWAYAINDAGVGVGNCEALAALWFRNTAGSWQALNLGQPAGGTGARAYDIGEVDGAVVRVAGYSIVSGKSHAVRWTVQQGGGLWSVARIEDLSPRGGNQGRGINTAGDMVGSRYWLTDGTSASLPGYRGGSWTGTGYDISGGRKVVGGAWKQEYGADRATLWILR